MVGFDELLDELFGFGLGETKEGDAVNPVLVGDGAVVVVFLDETANLVHLFFRCGSDSSAHIDAVFWLQHNIDTNGRKFKSEANYFQKPFYFATSFIFSQTFTIAQVSSFQYSLKGFTGSFGFFGLIHLQPNVLRALAEGGITGFGEGLGHRFFGFGFVFTILLAGISKKQ